MFKSKKGRINPNTTDTLIGEGTVIEGKVKSSAGLRLEGQITGDIECVGDVTIGEKGNAKSNITARNIIIAGKVQGNATTKGILTITSTGSLHGNILANSFVIEKDGNFQGTSRMEKEIKSDEKAEKEPQQSQQASQTQPLRYQQGNGEGNISL